MFAKVVSILGLVAVVASAGCATARTRTVAVEPQRTDIVLTSAPAAVVVTEPAMMPADFQRCEGWFDGAAGVCDTLGD